MSLTIFDPRRFVGFEGSNHARFPCLLFLTVTVLINCGCGDAPKPAVQQDASRESETPVADTKEQHVASPGSLESISEPSNNGGDNAAASEKPPTDDLSTYDPQYVKTAPTSSGTSVGSTAETVRRTVEPTPEQLARWAQPDYEPLQLLACRELIATGFVSDLAQAIDGRHILTAGTQVTLWSIESDVPEHVFLELKDDQSIKSLAVSPDGKWFAAGDSEGTLRIWSLSDRKELISKKLYPTGIIQVAVAPDSQEIATISYDAEITIWNADRLEQKNRFKVVTNGLERIEFMTPELLVAAGETTSSWNVGTGKPDKTLSQGRYNFTMARSPDGERFLFGEDNALQFLNVTDQKPGTRLTGSFAKEELVAFSPDGKLLATANDSAVRLWNISNRQMVQIIDAFGSPVTGLSWLPDTNLLVVASENGRTRIWGTVKDGATRNLQPLHSAVTIPDAKSRVPASPQQMLQTIELRTFPRLPDGDGGSSDEFNIRYDAAVTPAEAQLFYRYQFGKAGWDEVAASVETPGSIRFQKDSFMISASFYEGAESKTSISVNFAANFDVRWAPKFDAAPIELVFENEDTVIYRTKADLIQLETTLLRKMHDAGWTAYARLHASHNEQQDGRDLEFLQNGMTLRVSIGRFPADPTSYNVQYSRFLTANSIPVPPDSGFVEFDGATEPFLVATTSMALAQTREFYDTEMIAQGWLVRDNGRSLNDDHNWLVYVRGQQDFTVGLQSLPTGKTLVRVGDELGNSSWQLAKPEEPDATGTTGTTLGGIEAADFPILNESKSAKFDGIDKSLEFSMDAVPLVEVGKRYAKELQSLGWQPDGPGVKADDYVFITFVREKAEIALRARITDGKTIVSISGDGLLWTKALPGGRNVISYETWLRINRHPASLDLLDQYQKEMRSIVDGKSLAETPE